MGRKRGIDTMHAELSEAQAEEGWRSVGASREAAPAELESDGGAAPEEESHRLADEVRMSGWQPGMVMEPTRAVFQQLGRLDGQGRMSNIGSQRTILGVRGEAGVVEVHVPGVVTYTADEMQMGVPVRYLVREEGTGNIVAFHEVFIPPRRLEYMRYESRLAEPVATLLPAPGELARSTPPAGTPIGPTLAGDGGPSAGGPDLRTLTAAFAGRAA